MQCEKCFDSKLLLQTWVMGMLYDPHTVSNITVQIITLSLYGTHIAGN